MISVNATAVTAGGASADRRGRIIATKTTASNKKQIPIFRMPGVSIDMKNPISIILRFAVENVN
jgi:hypothetical protein